MAGQNPSGPPRGSRPPRLLRLLARLLIRGPDRAQILADLDELLARDRKRGISRTRARRRYLGNLSASAASVWRARLHAPRVPGVSWLDVKLGLRVLGRHPGLTLVAVFALALAIPVGLAPIQLTRALNATLPFDEGERIVGLQNWDQARSDSRRPQIRDFELWRATLTSFQALAAADPATLNLITDDGRAEAIRGSAMTASAFDVVRTKPLLGRTLRPSDEREGAPPVVVLGYDVWTSRFGGDPDAVGRTVQVGAVRREVVGVMPEGFLFPYRDHLWIPFQLRARDHAWGEGPDFWVFGRLADDVSMEQARAELTTVGLRAAADHPETHGRVRAELLPLAWALTSLRGEFVRVLPVQMVALLLLAVACGNVGTLMLARTATRSSEIAVRNALGATRARVVGQLFVEAFVLTLVAAGVGLGVGTVVVGRLHLLSNAMPFWFDLGVDPGTLVAAVALATFSAVLAGGLPALKATGSSVHRSLQRATAGASGLRFGGLSTLLIVAEVGISVGFLSLVGIYGGDALRSLGPTAQGVAADEYLTARLAITTPPPSQAPSQVAPDAGADASRPDFASLVGELVRRLDEDPAVRGIALGSQLPGTSHPRRRIEVEGEAPSPGEEIDHFVRAARVTPGFFQGFGAPVISGRAFSSADEQSPRRAVIVNQSFVDDVLHGGNPLGRRIRDVATPGEDPRAWYRIVGVVPDLGMNLAEPGRAAGFYEVATFGSLNPIRMAIHLKGDPVAYATRLRAVAAQVEPTLLVMETVPLTQVFSEELWGARWMTFLFGVLAAIAMVLSLASLYALMSFTVSERTREIGIRTALGATRTRVLRAIATRAFVQLLAGVVLGTIVVYLGATSAQMASEETVRSTSWGVVLGGVSGLMMAVGLLACLGPALRGLGIQPGEALRDGA